MPPLVASSGGSHAVAVLRLDAPTRQALKRAADAIALSPTKFFGDGLSGATFEPVDETQIHIDMVLCTTRIMQVPEEVIQTLQTDLQKLIAAAASNELVLSMPFLRFEFYQPDPSILVARFKVPDSVTSLRKAVWRMFKAAGVAFPDALWLPHVKLGRFTGLARGQANELSTDSLAEIAPEQPVRLLGLAMLGTWPTKADSDWSDILAFGPTAPPLPPPDASASAKRPSFIRKAGASETSLRTSVAPVAPILE
eukprot:TRINITY_DN65660_c0_g1_i1.p1 TRINITY_DN65660_c0_g1~~TRINITY_DN65660_c0_g1_i1.p1  ORF type:complete len:253 (-),score=38.32 TRINITY_DN65660_c0_g1_i1:12-770(-)